MDVEEPCDPADLLIWRAERFLDIGYDEDAAYELASVGADHHRYRRLVDQGCGLMLAREILE